MSNRIWNRLGALAQIEQSELGANLVANNSPAYAPAKFLNGIYATGSAKFARLNNFQNVVGTTPEEFTIGVFLKFTDFTVSNGVASTQYQVPIHLYETDNYILIQFRTDYFQLSYSGNGSGVTVKQDTTVDAAANELIYLSIVYAKTGIGATTDMLRVYWNGIEIAAFTVDTTDNAFLDFQGTPTLTIGGRGDAQTGRDFDGVIDNIKINNSAKTDISNNMNNEGFGGKRRRGN